MKVFEVVTSAVRAAAVSIAQGSRTVISEKGKGGDYVTASDLASQRVIRETMCTHDSTIRYLFEEEENRERARITKENWMTIPKLLVADELDGTTNHSCGLPFSAVMAGYYAHGEPQCAAIFHRGENVLYSCYRDGESWKMQADGKDFSRPPAPSSLAHAIVGSNYGYGTTPLKNIALWQRLPEKVAALRVLGSAGVDMILLVTGRLHCYIGSSFKPFDHGAGLMFLRTAGLRVETWRGKEATIWDPDFIAAPPELLPAFRGLLFG